MNKNPKLITQIKYYLLPIIIFIFYFWGLGWITSLLWNYIVVPLFDIPILTYKFAAIIWLFYKELTSLMQGKPITIKIHF